MRMLLAVAIFSYMLALSSLFPFCRLLSSSVLARVLGLFSRYDEAVELVSSLQLQGQALPVGSELVSHLSAPPLKGGSDE